MEQFWSSEPHELIPNADYRAQEKAYAHRLARKDVVPGIVLNQGFARTSMASQVPQDELPPYRDATRNESLDSSPPDTPVEHMLSFLGTLPSQPMPAPETKRPIKPDPFAWQLEGHPQRSQPEGPGSERLRKISEPITYAARHAKNFRGFKDLSFLKDAMSMPASDFGAVQVSDGSGTHLITGVDVDIVKKRCGWIIDEHRDGSVQDRDFLDMKNYPQTCVVAWLRWLYIDDYTFCEAMLDGGVPLMLHLQVLHFARMLRIPRLCDQAQMHMDRVITECISTKNPVLELCESVRFIYTELRECEGLRNLIANYCISNLEAHFDNEEEAFRQTAFQSPLFHKDLIRANIESNFQCRWADKIIQMSVCEAKVHTNAAVDGATSDFTCEFHVPADNPNASQRPHAAPNAAAPQQPRFSPCSKALPTLQQPGQTAIGSTQAQKPLILPDAPTTLPVRAKPPPASSSVYNIGEPDSTNTYPGKARLARPLQLPSPSPPPPSRYVNSTKGEPLRDAGPKQPSSQTARTFPLRPGEPTEKDIRNVLQNPLPGRMPYPDREPGPKYPIPQQIADMMRHGHPRPRPTQPKPASAVSAGPAHSSAHRRQSEQIRKFELMSEMRENAKRANTEDGDGGEQKYKIRVTTAPKAGQFAPTRQQVAAKSALADLLNGRSDYSANAAKTSAQELEQEGWAQPEGGKATMQQSMHSKPRLSPFAVGYSEGEGSHRDVFAKPRTSPFEGMSQAALLATRRGRPLDARAVASGEAKRNSETNNEQSYVLEPKWLEKANTLVAMGQGATTSNASDGPRKKRSSVSEALRDVHDTEWDEWTADAKTADAKAYVVADVDEAYKHAVERKRQKRARRQVGLQQEAETPRVSDERGKDQHTAGMGPQAAHGSGLRELPVDAKKADANGIEATDIDKARKDKFERIRQKMAKAPLGREKQAVAHRVSNERWKNDFPAYMALQAAHRSDLDQTPGDTTKTGANGDVKMDVDDRQRDGAELEQANATPTPQVEASKPSMDLGMSEPVPAGSPTAEDYEVVVLSDEEDWEMLSG